MLCCKWLHLWCLSCEHSTQPPLSLSLLLFLWWQTPAYMWSFYSNPVASMISSVNFPIGCLTKWEKQKKTLGIRLTLRGWGLLLEFHFYSVFNLLNDCHCWTVTIGNQSECEITVFDQLNDLTFRAPRHAVTRWHSFFFLLFNITAVKAVAAMAARLENVC